MNEEAKLEKKNKLQIWTYWESANNSKKPAYLELCFQTLQKHCIDSEIHLVTPDNIHSYIKDLDINLDDIKLEDPQKNPISLKADYIRARLLHDHGGLWLDMDCIAFNNFDHEITTFLKKYDFICMQKNSKSPPYVTNNFMASVKGGVVIKSYLEQMTQTIKRKLSEDKAFSWSEIGSSMLTPIVNANINNGVFLLPELQVHPFDFKEAKLLEVEKTSEERISLLENKINQDTKCVMLYNALHSNEFKSLNHNQIFESNCLISEKSKRRR